MITEKSQREENRLSHEHTQQVRDLHQDLLEAEQRLDDLTETHDVQIQVPHTRGTYTAKGRHKRESKNAKQMRNTKQNFFTLVCVTPKR